MLLQRVLLQQMLLLLPGLRCGPAAAAAVTAVAAAARDFGAAAVDAAVGAG